MNKYYYFCGKFIEMFESLYNTIYLKLWSGDKKMGPQKNVFVSKSCEIFGDTVYDLKWSLKYIHKNGKTSTPITISERANKWDLRKLIRQIEKDIIPQKIKELIKEHERPECVK